MDNDELRYISSFRRFSPDDMVFASERIVTLGMWGSDDPDLGAGQFWTGSEHNSVADYYIDVYKENPVTNIYALPQFSLAYGHYAGSGSLTNSTTKGIYNQFKSRLLRYPAPAKFTFYGDTAGSNDCFFIVPARSQMKDGFDPGNWELHLSGSGGTIKLIDDSTNTLGSSSTETGRQYNIVSGTVAGGIGVAASTKTYGRVYADAGTIVLDAAEISASVGMNLTSSAAVVDRLVEGWTAISASSYFAARSMEAVKSTYYFVRATTPEYNFSNNPTFVTGSEGKIRNSDRFFHQKVWITTVGLYNDNQELLAVGKLNPSRIKSFVDELLVRVRLDY